jgi:iron complex outermembrane receptor protein
MLIFTAADAARISSESIAETTACNQRFERTDDARVIFPGQSSLAIKLLLLGCLIAPQCAFSQSKDQAPTGTAALAPSASKTPAPPQVVPRVTTTVVVHDEIKDGYLSEAVTVGTLDGASLKETPLSVMEVTRELLDDQGARLLSDVVKNDASVGEDYAPVGYFGDYQIRGYVLDQETGFQVNGLTVVGEQNVPLENKQSVEILKGNAGVESGVASGGGLIDYVTKRPVNVEALDMATDHRGSSYGAIDLGRLFDHDRVGARVNMGGERIESYVNGADNWRAVGAGAVDWHISPKAILKGDFEYQHAVGRSVCGYQLLGGTTVPDLSLISPATMLGEQSWEKPNTFDTTNSNARFDYDLSSSWKAFAAASYSHSLRDDNVVYAYGTPMSFDPADGYYDIPNCAGVSNPQAYFFCPAVPDVNSGGDYGIYDWREPGVVLINAQAEAMLIGHLKTGPISQDLTGGGELFLRSAQEPGAPPNDAPSTVQDGPVYTYVGSENIYQPIAPVPLGTADSLEYPLQSAGPRRLYLDSHQVALVVQDRIHLPGRIQLLVSGREDSLHDNNYSHYATNPAASPNFTNKFVWLPEYAITYNPVSILTLYGNYGILLSLAPQASWFTDNSNQYLSPFFTRQAEVGAKYEFDHRIMITTALFHMRAPFFYPKLISAPDGFCTADVFNFNPSAINPCFESEGHDTHDGIEVNAEGKATSWMRLTASAAAIRAISDDTGTPAFENKQVINEPHLRTALFADLLLPHAHSLHLMPGWGYTGRKEATRDDAVSVSGYNLFNLGARYTPGGEGGRVTLRLYADNIADKRYWKDTGGSGGDTFIHLGAPTTVRLSAHYTF